MSVIGIIDPGGVGGVLDLGSGQDLMVAATVAWSFTDSTIVGLAGHLIKITAGCRSA